MLKFALFIRRHRKSVVTFIFLTVALAVIMNFFSIDRSTNEMIVGYMKGLGWEIEASPSEITHFSLPDEFDAVYRAYNAMQKSAGFDLGRYKGKKVTRYSYRVLNHKNSSDTQVVAGIFVCDNVIIAGDISSVEQDGFMHSVSDTSYIAE